MIWYASPSPATGSTAFSPMTPSGATHSSVTSLSPSLTCLLLARNTAPGAASTLPPAMAPTRTATTRGNIAGGVVDGGIPGGHAIPAADREAAVAEVCAGRSTAPIEMMGAGVLRNARPGIWIADRHLVQCPRCNVHMCSGSGRTTLCSIPGG